MRALDIPAYMNGASRGLLPQGDPHHFDRTRSDAFKNADVILIVGTRSISVWATASEFLRKQPWCRLTRVMRRLARIEISVLVWQGAPVASLQL